MFYNLFVTLSLLNPVCILYLQPIQLRLATFQELSSHTCRTVGLWELNKPTQAQTYRERSINAGHYDVIDTSTQGNVASGVKTFFLCDSGCTETRWSPPTQKSACKDLQGSPHVLRPQLGLTGQSISMPGKSAIPSCKKLSDYWMTELKNCGNFY